MDVATESEKKRRSGADAEGGESAGAGPAKPPKASKKGDTSTNGGSCGKVKGKKKGKKKGNGQAEEETPPVQTESLLEQPATAGNLPVPSVQSQQALDARPIPRDRVVNVLNFTLKANKYLHCVQAERGSSTCFVSSRGRLLSDTMSAARIETDKALEALKSSPIYTEVATDFNREQALKAFRQDIDFNQSRYLQILTGYNMLVDGILESIFKLVNPLHSIKLGMVLGCYNSFLYLKDTVGRERATLGAILSDVETRGNLSPMGHLTLVANMGAQKAFTKAFISTGISDDLRADFIAFCRDSPTQLIELDRNLMISREAANSVMSMLTAEGWFKLLSGRMNQLDSIQKKLTLSILETAKTYCEQEKPMPKPKKPKAPKKKKPPEAARSPKISMDGSEKSMEEDGQQEESDFMKALASLQEGHFEMPSDWTDAFPGAELLPSTQQPILPGLGESSGPPASDQRNNAGRSVV